MWCYEKSKIETQWTPKKPSPPASATSSLSEAAPLTTLSLPLPPPPTSHSDEGTITTNSDSCTAADEGPPLPPTSPKKRLLLVEKQTQQPSHHRMPLLSRPKLRSLLAALSFEKDNNHPKPFRKKKSKAASSQSATVSAAAEKSETSTPTITQSLSSSVHRGLRIDSDESDVFFDAEQFGDDDLCASNKSFAPRESVVLQGIKVLSLAHSSSVETELSGGHSNGIIVTSDSTDRNSVERGGGFEDTSYVDSGSSEEEFEYSEYEYHEHSQDDNTDGTRSNNRVRSHKTVELIPEAVTPPPLVKSPPLAPSPPAELPLRFLRAGKNDPVEGLRRYEATLLMRQQNGLDTILREASPDFATIKKHYPHYFMGKGKMGEPCFYEQPPKTNLRALRENGVTLDKLLRHYTMVTEFQWQYLERDDLQRSVYVIDLDGIRMTDFVGEAVDFVKKAAAFSAQHYPERAGYVYIINVPSWFKLIWNVVSSIVDADTLQKIYILRGKDEIRIALQERIPLENIPSNFGGTAVPLGESPEEKELADLVTHNNALAEQGRTVCDHDCKFCKWIPARSY